MSAEHHSPLAQFEVHPLLPLNAFGYDISFTNASLWMLLTVAAVLTFLSLGGKRVSMVPGRWQSMAEISMEVVMGTMRDIAGKESLKYFPYVFSLFIFILFSNLLGMIPAVSFTTTSHIIVTFALAAAVFVATTVLMIVKQGFGGFLHYFLPHGTPWWMIWLIYPIEVISYLARPVSLSIRLAANMMAGHTLLKIIAGFVGAIGLLGVAPFALLIALTGFEIGIAMLQAYIFTVLTCVYLNDALHGH
jgi:F-type H+-transporting ATPase subunit a